MKISSTLDAKEFIKDLLSKKNISQKKVAEMIGITPMAVSKMLASKEMQLGTFIKVLNLLGYEVTITPRNKNQSSDVFLKFTNEFNKGLREIESKYKKKAERDLKAKDEEILNTLDSILVKLGQK